MLSDVELRAEAWFDPEVVPEGWVDEDLVSASVAAGATVPRFMLMNVGP